MSLTWEDDVQKPAPTPKDGFGSQPRQQAQQQQSRGGGYQAQHPPVASRQDGRGRGEDGPSSGAAFGQRARVSSNTFANGADQNCGNVMTDHPSTRVLRPPGGASSFQLG